MPQNASKFSLICQEGNSIIYHHEAQKELIIIDLMKNTINTVAMPGDVYYQKNEKIITSAAVSKDANGANYLF